MGPDPTAPPTNVTTYHLNYSNISTFTVSSVTSATEGLKDQMLHGSTQIPSNFWNGGIVGSELDTTKCNICHTGLPTSYAPGKFHTIVSSASLTSCKDCHVNTVPKDIVKPVSDNGSLKLKPMDHAVLLTGGLKASDSFDCKSCHVGTQTSSFDNATFHTNLQGQSAVSCTACHHLTMPQTPSVDTGRNSAGNLSNLGALGFMHTSSFNSGDCSTCHTVNNTEINNLNSSNGIVSTNWSGGYYHKNINPPSITSCNDCHTSKPSFKPALSLNAAQYMNHSDIPLSSDCFSCHKTELTSGVTPTSSSWNKSALFHKAGTATSMANDPITSCQNCHGLTNGGGNVVGTNNNIPAGLKDSTTLSTFPASNSTLFDQILHSDVNVVNLDCNKCHSSTANMGMAGMKWKGAKFHVNVTGLTGSTNCNSCHGNILTYIRANGNLANGQNHSTDPTLGIGTRDCKECHVSVAGTGVLGSASNPPNWLGAIGGMPEMVTMKPPTGTTRPNLIIPHPEMGPNVTCASCHGSTITAKIIGYDHSLMPTGTVCVYCHLSTQQIVTGVTGFSTKANGHEKFNANTKDCNSCHYLKSGTTAGGFKDFKYPTKSLTTPAKWSGGKWK